MQSPRRSLLLVMVLLLSVRSVSRGQTNASLSSTAGQDSQTTPLPDSGPTAEIVIPGPLRSLLRMAGVSQKISPDEALPLIARNVYVQGYVGWQESGRPTEFLILLRRYVNQAKELAKLAGPSGTIRFANCEEAVPLLQILGYRLHQACGQNDASLVTSDPERAFLTTDSGFPLSALEDALRQGKEFRYLYPASRVPILFSERDWIDAIKAGRKEPRDVLELLLRHPTAARLYWALSRDDAETRAALLQSVGLRKLLPVAASLDFYGSNICIREGRVRVPGGVAAEGQWAQLVGASPQSPAEFVPRLLAKDNSWLAAYFDSLSRINQEQQRRFTDHQRLRTFYAAFRTVDPSSDAARPAFRRAPSLLLLLTRMQWADDGQPIVPGGLDLWKEILDQKTDSKIVREWGHRARHWDRPEQLAEAMVAFTKLEADAGPLQMYLLFTELDRRRSAAHSLQPETLRLLARRFQQYSDQYVVFSEFPELDDASITSFVNTAEALDKISNHTLRGNAIGIFQANIGFWQILARQQQIPSEKLNDSWQQTIKPFAAVRSAAQIFDAGCNSFSAILRATGSPTVSQDEIIELLAGPRQTDVQREKIHGEIAREIRSVMDGQRLVSLDTLLTLGKGLNNVSKGTEAGSALLPLAAELREFEMPRPIFTSSERDQWASGVYNNRHTDLQMQTDLSKTLKSSPSRAQLEEARGQLAPFLRDTLVGLNYAYYAPPGAQLLRANPLFVRSHDFSGDTVMGIEGLWHAPQLFGQGAPAGGGARFVGSLADLPYALSEAEQDFIAPENVQALIWRETVPALLASAILPRWWSVSGTELHAVALYQLAGEELLSASASNAELRAKVMNILLDRITPARASRLEEALQAESASEAISQITPADSFYITAEFRRRFPNDTASWGQSGQELDRLCRSYPADLNWMRLSRDFGVPHRALAQTYERELLNVSLFPAASGYASRLLAESWDSNNLYWARLADEMGYSPAMLNRLVPELTRRMVAKIFATDFEDWQALLRAMRETGEEFRKGKITVLSTATTAADQLPMN